MKVVIRTSVRTCLYTVGPSVLSLATPGGEGEGSEPGTPWDYEVWCRAFLPLASTARAAPLAPLTYATGTG